MSTQRQKNIAMLQMLLCAALWSIAGIFIKLIPWNSFVLAGLRSLIAGGVIFAYMRMARLRLVINRRTLFSGFLMAWLYFSFVGANKLTTAANAIALQYTAPLFIMLLSALLFHEKLRRPDVIAAVITFLGIVLFFFDQLGPGKVIGNFVALISGVLFAAMYLSLGVMADANERMSYVLLGQLFTFVLSIPSSCARSRRSTARRSPSRCSARSSRCSTPSGSCSSPESVRARWRCSAVWLSSSRSRSGRCSVTAAARQRRRSAWKPLRSSSCAKRRTCCR